MHREVAVFGLGLMGGAIAENLSRAGHRVHGFDIAPAACDKARAIGIHVIDDPGQVPGDVDLVLCSLPSATSLHQTVEALVRHLPASCVVGELSTLALADKEQARARLGAFGVSMLDCPISGTGAQAVQADLSIYASGDRPSWDRVADIFSAFARRPRYVGAFGMGTRLKYVANLLVAIHNVATAEAMSMAEAAGIDGETAVEVLREGAGNSRIFELRAPMMTKRIYLPATMKLEVWQKDMELIASFARERGVKTPLFDATQPVYEAARARGPQDDTASVFEVMRA